MNPHWKIGSVVLTIGLCSLVASPSRADMVLTNAGQTAGFQLTTFATGFSHTGTTTTGIGPLGIAFAPSGVVLVSTEPGDLYRLPNHQDGQSVTSANIVSHVSATNLQGLSTLGERVFVSSDGGGSLFEIHSSNNFSTVNYTKFGPTLSIARDLRTNFATGNLFVVTGDGIIAVNPSSGASRLVTPQGGGDGMTIDESGKTVYLTDYAGGHVLGFNIQTGTPVFDSGFISNNPIHIDGIALGTGSLARELFVNDNGGRLWEVDLDTKAQTLIGTGGSRGDYVAVDPTDGTLFITQSDRILHLTAPGGGGFGGSVPEPSSFVLLGLGLIGGFRILARRRRIAS